MWKISAFLCVYLVIYLLSASCHRYNVWNVYNTRIYSNLFELKELFFFEWFVFTTFLQNECAIIMIWWWMIVTSKCIYDHHHDETNASAGRIKRYENVCVFCHLFNSLVIFNVTECIRIFLTTKIAFVLFCYVFYSTSP